MNPIMKANNVNTAKLHYVFSFPSCIAILLLLTGYRIWVLSQSSFDLYPDEAQYWFWSLTPGWGYYSKPPMVAWLIYATTSLCEDTEFCIRLSSPILHFFTALCVYGIAYSLREGIVAWCSALTYITLPAVSLSSLLISTDVPFLFFWALALYAFVKAIESEHIGWWVLAGVAAGLGMLSKYTMILFLPSALLALWLIPHYRKYLTSKGFYLAIIITAAIYLPNLLWNYQHGFVSYLHTRDNANIQGYTVHPLHMLEFIGSQFGVFGPILFSILIVIIARRVQSDGRYLLLFCFTLPFLLVITGISLLSRAHANWAAPVYIAATVAVTTWLVTTQRYRLLLASLILHIAVMGVGYHYDGIRQVMGIPATKATDPFRTLRGWKKLGAAVSAIHRRYPDTILLTNDRKTTAALHYYIKPTAETVKWNADGRMQDHFELTTHMNGKEGKDFLLVVKPGQQADIPAYFKASKHIARIEVGLYPDYRPAYDVYKLTHFKGY